MRSENSVLAAAKIVRRLRECDAPNNEDKWPCSFCEWGWGDGINGAEDYAGGNFETGCVFIAREILKAADAAE